MLEICSNVKNNYAPKSSDTNFSVVPAKLPDGNVNEIYGYPAIAGHAIGATGGNPPSQNNRLHNADSFAFLASGMC